MSTTTTEKSFLDMSINEMLTASSDSIGEAYDTVTTTTLEDVANEVHSWFVTPEKPLTKEQMTYAIHMHACHHMLDATHLSLEDQRAWYNYYVEYYTYYYNINS